MQRKDTNPKDACGVERAPISTVPMGVMLEVGNAMLEGARKYGRHNYRAAGVRHSIYVDAVFRHLAAHWEGEQIDPDSGLPHITKAIAALVVLRDSMIQENDQDDRPPASPDGIVKTMNAGARDVIAKTLNPAKPWTQADMDEREVERQNREAARALNEGMGIVGVFHAEPPIRGENYPTGRDMFHSVADETGDSD